MNTDAHWFYVVVEVEPTEGHLFTFRDEGPGWTERAAAEAFAREIYHELGHRAEVFLIEEWTSRTGEFKSKKRDVKI